MSKSIIYRPSAGEHIAETCENAVRMAREKNSDVIFTHNDVEITATPSSSPDTLHVEWQTKMDAAGEAYRNSPEGIEDARQREADKMQYQAEASALKITLLAVLAANDLDSTMKWLSRFLFVSGWSYVEVDLADVAYQFEKAGFVPLESVGNPPEWFNSRERMGRYIVGQAIDGWKTIGCNPDILSYWAEVNYFELPAKGEGRNRARTRNAARNARRISTTPRLAR